MKLVYSILCITILFVGCKSETTEKETVEDEISVDEIFQKNSETILANLAGWQNENVDYSMYAEDFIMGDTGFGAEKDSINLKELIDIDKMWWGMYDFKILTDPLVLLPGVNAETKLADGSVRHYSEWEVTLPATDSTEAKSGKIQLYESFDFNEEGKIVFQQVYGDITGLMMYLNSEE